MDSWKVTNEELNKEDKNIYEYTLHRAMAQLGQSTNIKDERLENEEKKKETE